MNTGKRLTLAALLLFASPSVANAERVSEVAVPAVESTLVAQAGPTVILLEPGAEPRQELRYDFGSMTPQSMSMEMDMSMTMTSPAIGTSSQTLPQIRMAMSIPTVEVTPEGHLRMTFSLDRYEVVQGAADDPAMVQVLQSSLNAIGSISGWNTIDSRGDYIDGDITVTGDAAAAQMMGNIESSMEQMVAPFPLEAVGVGARWQTSTEINANGLTLAQTATFTLVGRNGNDIELAVAIEQNAPPQDIADPSMPPGSVAHLDEMRTTGSGRMLIALGSIVPRSELQMQTSMRMSVVQGGVSAPAMSMQNTIAMRLAPSP